MEIKVSNAYELFDAIKKANASDEMTKILIEKGVYEIGETLKMSKNIEIVGEEEVSFRGTKRLDLKTARVENGVYCLDLDVFDIADTGSFGLGPFRDFWVEYDIPKPHMTEYGPSLELYYGDKKMNLSRYPREGFMRINQAVGETPIFFKEQRTGSKEGLFIPSETDIFDNNNTENMLLVGYWSADWATQRHLIESYDKETKVIKVKEPYHSGYRDGGCYSGEVGGKFYALNVLTEVKNPGDWFIDRDENRIYFIPYEGQDYIDIGLCENMFEGENAENITVKNISVFGCRKSGFDFKDSSNITIENCVVSSVGAWGVILDRCSDSTVYKCHIYNTGGGGIAASGGDRATLKSSGNVVSNNEIHDIAYWHRTYLAAIEMNGVNVIATENKIYDVPHFGIVFQGNDHIIEKNYIRNACYESNDAGAIYAGRDYSCQGTIIRYNHLHDLYGFEGRGCIGIYFDDGMCTAEVYGNVLTNVPYVAVLIGGGRDFKVYDNTFFNCKITVMFDDRMDRWGSKNSRQVKHLLEVPYRSEIWKKAYPNLYNVLEDEPTLPKYNKFYNNKVVGGDGVAMTNETLEQYFEHYGNTYTELSYNTPHIWHLEKWFYLTDKL